LAIRYPGELPELTLAEAEQALEFARQVWIFVLQKLPIETHLEENR
jgi:hypothetical protein